MDIKLVIPKKIHNKYTYLLNRFKSLEWSGPAWYKVKTDEDGFPTEWRIVHFHPLDLGNHASTEWEAKDLATILKETYASMPSLKKAYMGLIHSHNTMGAFLSGTDTSTITDMAPDEGFYGSLVVASAGKATHAFGFSYKDQYKYSHCLELDEDDIFIVSPDLTPLPEWIEEANTIEKNKPKYNNRFPARIGQQATLWNTGGNKGITLTKEAVIKNRRDVMEKLTKKQQKVLSTYLNELDEEAISEIEFERKAEKLGIKVTDILKLYNDDVSFNYGYNYGGGYGI